MAASVPCTGEKRGSMRHKDNVVGIEFLGRKSAEGNFF
jgi:hypothetical protein